MGILLGGLASLLFGVGDFLGGEGARRANAASIVLWAGLVSFPAILIAALLTGGEATRGDLALGAAAGTAGAFGLVTLFSGLARGQAAAVAPSAAVLSGIFPVIVAVLMGERPSALAWAGVVLAIPAIVLCSWIVTDDGKVGVSGFVYGLGAGLGFGGYTILIDRTSATSGLLPLIPARAATMVVVVLIALFGLWKVRGPAGLPKGIVAANGLFDVAGNVALLAALRFGSLALVAVTASFYPAITVIMARIVNSELLLGRQVVGIALSLAALAAIALG